MPPKSKAPSTPKGGKGGKAAPKIVTVPYVIDLVVNTLLVDTSVANYDKIMITIKIGDAVSFSVLANRVDNVYEKARTTHEIQLTPEQLIALVELPVDVYFKKAPPEEEINPEQNIEEQSSKKRKSNDSTDKKRKSEDKNSKKNQSVENDENSEVKDFGEFNMNWAPNVLKYVNEKKFSIHTQFEDRDILKPIEESEPPPPVVKISEVEAEAEAEEIEEIPRQIVGFISMVIKLQVKPKSKVEGLADENAVLFVADEIGAYMDPNDTIFVIGNDQAAKYEKIFTQCNDHQCPVRIDINKLKSVHGRLVNTTQIIGPCGNLDCCNECSDNEDCFCDKFIAGLEAERKKNYCYTKRRPRPPNNCSKSN